MTEVWIIERLKDGDGYIESVWDDDTPALAEAMRLREAHGFHYAVTCWQVESAKKEVSA